MSAGLYGELVVVVGDAHVGHRSADIPDKFKKMLTPNKMQYLISTGNLCSPETFEFFRSVAPKMYSVRGDMDDYASVQTSAEEIVFEVGEFKIGVCHGHQVVPWGDRDALGLLSRRLDVDILITGHTHVCETFEVEGTWFVNPGSITGAYTPLKDDVRPSFALLSIQANSVMLYMYELNSVSGEVDIRRTKFSKPSTKNPFSSSVVPAPEITTTTTKGKNVESTPTKRPQEKKQQQQQQTASELPTTKRPVPIPPSSPSVVPPAEKTANKEEEEEEKKIEAKKQPPSPQKPVLAEQTVFDSIKLDEGIEQEQHDNLPNELVAAEKIEFEQQQLDAFSGFSQDFGTLKLEEEENDIKEKEEGDLIQQDESSNVVKQENETEEHWDDV